MLKLILFSYILLFNFLSVSCKNEVLDPESFDEVIKVIIEPKNGSAKVLNNDTEASHVVFYVVDSVLSAN